MKLQFIVVCLALMLCSVSVQGQAADPIWTGLKCGMDNDKLYDRSLNIDTCKQYCYLRYFKLGKCELNNGYGECKCGAITTTD